MKNNSDRKIVLIKYVTLAKKLKHGDTVTRAKHSPKLNPKQLAFCREYIIDFNSSNAAKRAEYSEKTARTIGSKLLTNVDIQNEIKRLSNKVEAKHELTIERLITELLKLATSDVGKVFDENGNMLPINQIPEDTRKAIAAIEILEEHDREGNFIGYTKKVKFWDKPKAIEMLGKHLAMFTEKMADPDGRAVGSTFIDFIKYAHENRLKNLKEIK